MGPLPCMRSVVDRKVVMRRIPVQRNPIPSSRQILQTFQSLILDHRQTDSRAYSPHKSSVICFVNVA